MRLISCVIVFLVTMLLNSAIFAQGFFEQEPYDPIENINRTTHEFNKGLDRYAIRPTSNVYGAYVPELIRIPISNFRGNLNEPKRFIITFSKEILAVQELISVGLLLIQR